MAKAIERAEKAERDNEASLRVLVVAHGARVDVTNKAGQTVYDVAAANGADGCVALLETLDDRAAYA